MSYGHCGTGRCLMETCGCACEGCGAAERDAGGPWGEERDPRDVQGAERAPEAPRGAVAADTDTPW